VDTSALLDSKSFEQVFDEHFNTIHRYLVRRVGLTLADDLAGEAFMVAYQRRASYDAERGAVLAWLYGIANNLVRNQRRAEQRHLKLIARSSLPQVDLELDDAVLISAWAAPRLAAALRRITEGQREVLLMTAYTDLSDEEIAVALKIPVGTVRSRLSRGKASLRDKFGSFDFDSWTFSRTVSTTEGGQPQ
jgi:RNA polymerase sigma-70 factor (ECF subfamily)